jgi:type I restriction enzyme S subunit
MHQPSGWLADRCLNFRDVASRRLERVPSDDNGLVQRGSIHFDGNVSIRNTRAGTGQLFYAKPGDLVFSKIDARNGAIAVLSADNGQLAFSAEFPIYDLQLAGRIKPAFMQILCRTKAFQDRINSLVVGHSGRRRLAPEILEGLQIPVPDLVDQEAIVSDYRANIEESREQLQRGQSARTAVSERLLEELGISYSAPIPGQRYFKAQFHQLSSWSTKKVRHLCAGTDDVKSRFPMVRLGDRGVGEIAYGLAKSPANRPDASPRPYLRVANVQAGELDLSEVKEIDVPDNLMPRYSLQSGDLLLCEGNSEALVGRPAVWRNEIPNCVHQNHVLRVRLASLNPDFVALYMNTAPARAYFQSRAKRTTNLASINSSDVADFWCPSPPTNLQEEIAVAATDELSQARSLIEDAEKTKEAALKAAEECLVRLPVVP